MDLGPEVDTVAGPADATRLPAHQRLLLFVEGGRVARMICVLAELGIADLLADGPRTAADLAGEVGADAGALYRIMRCTSTVGVFSERQDGRFTLTPMAEALREGGPVSRREEILASGHELLWRSPEEVLRTVRTGLPAVERGTGLDELRERLLGGPDVHPDTGPYDRVTHVTDEEDAEIPAGSDAYVMEGILRHRDDESAIRLLARVRAAMGDRADARLLLCEYVLGGANAWDRGKFRDVEMMVTLGGRERSLAEWRRLLAAAGFALLGRPRQGRWAVLESHPLPGADIELGDHST